MPPKAAKSIETTNSPSTFFFKPSPPLSLALSLLFCLIFFCFFLEKNCLHLFAFFTFSSAFQLRFLLVYSENDTTFFSLLSFSNVQLSLLLHFIFHVSKQALLIKKKFIELLLLLLLLFWLIFILKWRLRKGLHLNRVGNFINNYYYFGVIPDESLDGWSLIVSTRQVAVPDPSSKLEIHISRILGSFS